jgi:hypothetical protein
MVKGIGNEKEGVERGVWRSGEGEGRMKLVRIRERMKGEGGSRG